MSCPFPIIYDYKGWNYFFILQIIGKIRWIHINVTTPSCTTLKTHQIAFKQYITFTVQISVHSVGAQKDSDFKCCSTVCGQLLFFTCVPRTKQEAHVLPPASDDRSHSQITFIPNIGDGVRCPTFLGFFFSFSFFYLPAQLSLLPRSVLLYGVAFGGCTAVWVKTISCEIENNHVERDWDGSSFSSSPLLSADSWLLLIKSTTVWTVAHNTFLSKCGEYCFCHRPNMWWCITMGFYGHF